LRRPWLSEFLSWLPAPPTNERIATMTDTTMEFERTEQETIVFEVCDEVLEAAAGTLREKAASYTLAACSGLSVCPA
jgi:hypothetical protein